MLFAGETLDTQAALVCGLVDRVAADPQSVLDVASVLTRDIRKASWQALELTKHAIALQAPPGSAAFDAAAQAVLFESDEKRARMDRMLNRTKDGA
jgi:enoyl-CoA hydratase/carnithine racemase